MKHASIGVPPRRYEALAYIIDRLVKTGGSPSFVEIGAHLGVSKARAQGLVAQLIAEDVIEKIPGTQRALRVRDVTLARQIVEQVVRSMGWTIAEPLGDLQSPAPLPHVQLFVLPPFEHLPDAD